MTAIRSTIAATLTLVALAGCSSGGDDSSGGTPDCADVWQTGQTLPEDYDGCMDGDTIEVSTYYECDDGSKLTGYADTLFAFYGGRVQDRGSDDAAYSRAFARCKS